MLLPILYGAECMAGSAYNRRAGGLRGGNRLPLQVLFVQNGTLDRPLHVFHQLGVNVRQRNPPSARTRQDQLRALSSHPRRLQHRMQNLVVRRIPPNLPDVKKASSPRSFSGWGMDCAADTSFKQFALLLNRDERRTLYTRDSPIPTLHRKQTDAAVHLASTKCTREHDQDSIMRLHRASS